jgi:hypothetical protein
MKIKKLLLGGKKIFLINFVIVVEEKFQVK